MSVLIVARNQADATRRTLASLQPPGGDSASEVLVVDNASTDGGAALDNEFPTVKTLRMQRNFGWTRAVNVGTRTAQAEFICLTPPGVEYPPGTLEQLVSAFRAHPEASAVAPLAVDRQDTIVTRCYPLPDRQTFSQFWQTGSLGRPLPIDRTAAALPVDYLTGSPILLRRQSIMAMNYLDQRFGHFWADADLCQQIRRAGRRLLLLPKILVTAPPHFLSIPERLDTLGARLSADAALGAAAYLGKHQGLLAGASFHCGAALLACLSVFRFRQPGAHAARAWRILTGQKIDGSEGE